jgi:hypothetical protein
MSTTSVVIGIDCIASYKCNYPACYHDHGGPLLLYIFIDIVSNACGVKQQGAAMIVIIYAG